MSETLSVPDRPTVEQFLLEQVEAAGVAAEDITLEGTLESLGLDSLDVVELSQSVKKEFGIPVAPQDFLQARTISDAVSVVCRLAGIS